MNYLIAIDPIVFFSIYAYNRFQALFRYITGVRKINISIILDQLTIWY